MKSDNILLEIPESSDMCPTLAVTDFGCCLADKNNGLIMPYKTYETDRGGNISLMAPEVYFFINKSILKVFMTRAQRL